LEADEKNGLNFQVNKDSIHITTVGSKKILPKPSWLKADIPHGKNTAI